MAKELVTVCLPHCNKDDVHALLQLTMAPFDRNAPQGDDTIGEWDYWRIDSGGHPFSVAPGYESDPRIIRSSPDGTDEKQHLSTSFCDGGPRWLLDFEAARTAAAAEIESRWREWRELASKYSPTMDWGYFWQRSQRLPEQYSTQQARNDYESQPAIRHIRENPNLDNRFGYDPVAYYGQDLSDLVYHSIMTALPTEAILTINGEWVAGWADNYLEFFNSHLDGLPADTYVIRVTFHS